MASLQYALVLLIFNVIFTSASISRSILRTTPEDINDRISIHHRKIAKDDKMYCESWRYIVETNDANPWLRVPERCWIFVAEYVSGERYLSDSEAVADQALRYVKSLNLTGDGKDAWIFDIDETLLCNVPWYATVGFGSEVFDENSFNDWVELGEAPALPASMRLYQELDKLGIKIFLLTGRAEFQRDCTSKNLEFSGISNYERLILRGHYDKGKLASIYKSERRQELEDEGYRIIGNSGDQWSDLNGFALAKRSFKLPNPMYWIP